MRVPVRIFADAELLKGIESDNAVAQAINVAHMPGIVRASLAMPDAHWGYGFPIGGVAAFDPQNGGVVSPGGIGFDINCGVRLVRTDLTEQRGAAEAEGAGRARSTTRCPAASAPRRRYASSRRRTCGPSGRTGRAGPWRRASAARRTWSGRRRGGALPGADPGMPSSHAMQRGQPQVGTLGSGNHFLEVDVVDEVFDERAADAFGLAKGGVAVQIHCGSRGFGHQVCTDFLKTMQEATRKYGIEVPDRQLACAPLGSAGGGPLPGRHGLRGELRLGQPPDHPGAGRCARWRASSAAAGTRWACGRSTTSATTSPSSRSTRWRAAGALLCVHRKGATRAFPAGHPQTPDVYREVGQPVLIPGDMGTASYVLVGAPRAMEQTWGSTCHGAGRVMSRKGAIRRAKGRNIARELAQAGIIVRSEGRSTLAEEMPEAYKDVDAVVGVMHEAGITRKVARLRPMGVVKG